MKTGHALGFVGNPARPTAIESATICTIAYECTLTTKLESAYFMGTSDNPRKPTTGFSLVLSDRVENAGIIGANIDKAV